MQLFQVETNIDDQSPESFPYLLEKLFQAGAKDAWLAPIIMKKGRPAFTLTFLAEADKLEHLLDLAALESSTIGLRYFPVERKVYHRSIKNINTPWGPAKIKISQLAKGYRRVKPEYEDCCRLSRESGLPLPEIMAWFQQQKF